MKNVIEKVGKVLHRKKTDTNEHLIKAEVSLSLCQASLLLLKAEELVVKHSPLVCCHDTFFHAKMLAERATILKTKIEELMPPPTEEEQGASAKTSYARVLMELDELRWR